jgi:hypothetical protein
MRLTNFAAMDPHMLLGLVNTALRNDAEDLADLVASHDMDEIALRAKLLAIGYDYDPAVRQFRAAQDWPGRTAAD